MPHPDHKKNAEPTYKINFDFHGQSNLDIDRIHDSGWIRRGQ
jgi:hypothetical protein